jgi:hypothetical protein
MWSKKQFNRNANSQEMKKASNRPLTQPNHGQQNSTADAITGRAKCCFCSARASRLKVVVLREAVT